MSCSNGTSLSPPPLVLSYLGIRVLNPSLKRWPNWADIYPNISLMPKVTCPCTILHVSDWPSKQAAPIIGSLTSLIRVLAWSSCNGLGANYIISHHCPYPPFLRVSGSMQGTEDEVIAIDHGHKLHELCKSSCDPLWLDGYNHQNLELSPLYLPHLRKFLSSLP